MINHVSKIHITHIISGLGTSGAEGMLFGLLKLSDQERFMHNVISLTDEGIYRDRIRALGIPVQALGFRSNIPDPLRFRKLVSCLRSIEPNLIQTWMYHADFLGGLAAKMPNIAPVVWNVRHTNFDPKQDRRTTIWIAKLCARLSSRLPSKIICCAKSARKVHEELGYPKDGMVVIPNGFDLDEFYPNPQARLELCHELGIGSDVILIGMAARFHPQKDHKTFIKAAEFLIQDREEVRFLLCGTGIDWENDILRRWINEAGIGSYFYLLGDRDDIQNILAALDIYTLSSSHGEAFPNVVGEAMACTVPCVVTDVGDAGDIVGETGITIPVRDPAALAVAWNNLIDMEEDGRRALGLKARTRIQSNYKLSDTIKRYEEEYRSVVKNEG